MVPRENRMSTSTKSSHVAGSEGPLKVALMACWGIGLEMLHSLSGDPRVCLVLVLTRSPRPNDPWAGAVMEEAEKLAITTISFEGLSYPDLAAKLEEHRVNLLMVHAYPRLLPAEVFSKPRLGTINVHPSLLPLYRGPSPTLDVLADRARETGLTAHFMDSKYDTGDIIYQMRISLQENDTCDTVITRLKTLVPSLIHETITRIVNPDFKPAPQGSDFPGRTLIENTLP